MTRLVSKIGDHYRLAFVNTGRSRTLALPSIGNESLAKAVLTFDAKHNWVAIQQ